MVLKNATGFFGHFSGALAIFLAIIRIMHRLSGVSDVRGRLSVMGYLTLNVGQWVWVHFTLLFSVCFLGVGRFDGCEEAVLGWLCMCSG